MDSGALEFNAEIFFIYLNYKIVFGVGQQMNCQCV